MDSTRQAASSAKKNCSCGVEAPIREALRPSSSVQSTVRPPSPSNNQVNLAAAALFLSLYKWFLSPAIHVLGGAGMGCRYPQTCSEFAYQSLLHRGIIKGSFLSIRRLLSCNPWMAPRPKLMFAVGNLPSEKWNS